MDTLKKEISAILILVSIGLYGVWPVVINRNLIPNFGADALLITWILRQPIWSFQGNIFYPNSNVLAYADMFKLTALFAHGNFAIAMIGGQIATVVMVYLWWRRYGRWSALVGTVVLALSQIRFEYQVHLQMWNMQYWLAGVLMLVWGWRKNKNSLLYLGFGLLGLQMYESPLPILFAAATLALYGLTHKIKITKHLILAASLFLIIAWPGIRVYRSISQEFNFVRDIREAAHNSISVNDLWGHFWSPGLFVILALALLQKPKSKFLLVVLVCGLVMSFGPVLKWQDQTVKIFGKLPIPLPYAAIYYLVPGMGGFRTPSRWLWLAAFAASGLIASGLKNLSFKKAVILLAVAVVGGTKLTQVVSLPTYPNYYQQVKNLPGKVILELPVYTWPQEQHEVERMYFSLYHGKTLVNGYSGFTPPSVYLLPQNIPAGVDYIIRHNEDQTITIYTLH